LALLLALFAVLSFAGTTAGAAVTSTSDYVPGEVLIKFAPQADAAAQAAVLRDLGATELASFGSIHATRQRISRYDVAGAIARYRGDARLAYIEPNYLLHADRTPGDPMFSQLWGMQNTGQTGGTAGADIRATSAWDVTTGASPVLVSVIDTGMDYTHQDLAANVWTNPGEIPGNNIDDDGNGFIDDVHGWDFVNHDSDPMDDNGHGTHVSGTIGAVGDNGIGVTGVCWHAVQIMPLKFLDGSGSGSTGDAVLAIQYATMMHARILSNSWGGGSFSQTLQQAIQDASDAGILFVAAAGNDAVNNDFTPHYPANYDVPLVISVASTDANDSLSTFSCWGPTTVDLGAPGSGILSTLPGNSYGVYSGTSMATPHVSGALALMLSLHPAMTGPSAKVMLLNSVHPISALMGRTVTGGRLDAFAMLAEPDSIRPAPVTDLQIATTNGDWVALSWTATGDDSLTGRASNYDVRYSTSPITDGNFDLAVHVPGVPFPLPPGSAESVRVNGLAFGTPYWFAVKVADEFGTPSAISNIATATTLGPPVVAVNPDSLVADLLTGAQETQNLHVANNGASDLAFHLTSVEATLLAFMPDGRPLRAVGHRVPLERVAAAGVQRVVDLGADRVLDRAATPSARARAETSSPVRILGTEVFGSTQNGFYGGPRTRGNIFRCTTSTWLDEQRLYLEPTTPTQMWFLVYEGLAQTGTYRLISASNISPAGPGAGWYSSGALQVRLEPDRWYLIVGEWDQPVYYYNQSDVAPYPYPTSFGQLVAGAGWDWAPTVSFPPDSLQDVPSFAFGSPVAYYQTLVTRPGPHWLTPAPLDGVIAAGGNMDIAVAFDATSLNGGDYRSDLALSSNDPVHPVVHTPTHLHVTGAPDISLSRTSIDFGPRYTGTTTTDTLYVRNLGTDLLDVTNLSTSVGPFSVEPASFQLAPAGSQTVLVHYSPTATGPASGTLSIDSNDPDEVSLSVGLAGSATDPPILVVNPDSLTADLVTGEQASRTLHLQNSGASDLSYHVTINASENVVAAARLTRHFRASPGSTATASVPAAARRYEAGFAPIAGTRAIPAPTGALKPAAGPGVRILLVASGGDVSQIQALLAALPDVAAVDVFDSYPSAPSLALLKSYAAAIVITSVSSQVSGPLGDVLADYVDEGGGVVLTLASFVSGYQLGGRLFTGGYFPFQIGVGPVGSSTLGAYDPTHPIMRNVSTLNADLLAQVNLASGAQLVASYTNGFPAVATQGHHVAAVNAFVGASGYWSGDLPRLLRNAVAWAGGATWLSVAPGQGTVPPGTGVDLTATFDAAGLFGGDYRAGLGIASNDPVHPLVTTPVHLHVTGAPDIRLSTTALAFGTVFTGGTRTDTLVVRNVGTDELVVSGVTSPSPYTVSVTAFSLAPTASETLLVHFHPVSPGPYTGTLNVASNDADQPSLDVSLDGAAVDPPIVGVTPDSITADLVTGETADRLVTVSNTGASDLQYRIGAQPASAAAIRERMRIPTTFAAALLAGTATTDRMPSSLRARDTSVSGAKVLLIEDELPWGLFVNEAILLANNVVFNVIGSAQLATTDLKPYRLVIVPSTQPTSFYEALALQSAKFDDFVGHGGVLEFHAAGQSGGGSDSWLVTLPGGMHISPTSYSPLNHSLLPQHPIMANVPLAFVGSAASHAYLTSIPPSAKQIASDDSSRTNLVEYRFGNGTVLCGGQTFEFAVAAGWPQAPMLPNMIQYALSLGEVGWLTATPDNGVVPAGQNAEITAHFDAAGLYGGDYRADLVVSTNDPVTPDVRMPAHLHVTGAPDITLSATTITFGTEYTGTTHTDSLLVRNDGTDILHVSSVSTADPYSADPASFTLAPLESRRVFVHFAPTSAGPAPGVLSITSDDPDEGSLTVRLFGLAILPPIISVNPDSLGADLLTGQQETRTLHIANGGPNPLTFEIRAAVGLAPHLALRPVARRIAPAAGSTATSPSTQGRPDGPDAKRAPASKMASSRVLIVEDYYPWGFASNETVLTGLGIPFDVINSSQFASVDLSPYTVLVVPSVQPTSFYTTLGVDSLKLANFVGQGGVFEFHAASQSSGSDAWLLPIPGGLHVIPRYAGVNHVLLPGNPIVAGVPTDFSGSYASHSSLVSIPASAAQVTSDDQATTNCVVYHYGAGAVICSGQTLEFAWAYGWQGGPMLPNMLQYATSLAGTGWVRPDPQHASVPGGGNLDVTVTFDATGLNGGDYRTNLLVLSNDPVHPEVDVPAHLHVTGAPDIALSRTTIDFGSGFTGVARVDSFAISNVGTDILDVAPLSSDGPAFTLNPSTGFSVAPGASRKIYVTFLPPSAGGYSAILTVTSNDPDHPTFLVGLSGLAIDPPVIGLSPDSLTATLQPGQEEHQVLHVENTGGSPLQFSIDAVTHALAVPVYTRPPAAKGAADPGPSVLGHGGPDLFGYTWRDSDEPGGPAFSWIDITGSGTPLALFGDDATIVGVPIGFNFPFYGANFPTVNVSTNGFLSFTSSSAQFSNVPLPSPFAPANLVAVLWDDLYVGGSSVFAYHDSSKCVISWVSVTELGSAYPMTFEVILWPDGRIRYQYLYATNYWSQDATVGIQNGTATDGLTVESDNLTYLHNGLAVELSRRPRFLTVSPPTGTLPAGGNIDLDAAFTAVGAPIGDYRADVVVTSNDPVHPSRTVPAHLHVQGEPDIALSADHIAFGTVFSGTARTDSVTVTNAGTDILHVTGVSSDNTAFTAVPVSITLTPGSSRAVRVTFSPPTNGPYSGTLTITSDDPDEGSVPVALTGNASDPPVAAIDTDSLVVTLLAGQQATRKIHLSNTGAGSLDFTTSARIHSASVESFAIPAGAKGAADPGLSILGHGGPDLYGYGWTDSDQPGGPAFDWVDILATGTPLPVNGDDAVVTGVPIGFAFPFYGQDYTTINVTTNGFLSFTSSSTAHFNTPLPDSSAPRNMLAVMWDDLFAGPSTIYIRRDGTRTIVEWYYQQPLQSFSAHTFEVILYPDGRFKYQYLHATGPWDGSATVGIQNADASDGLTVQYNLGTFLHDQLAVAFDLNLRFLTVTPASGSLPPGNGVDLTAVLDADPLAGGDYRGEIEIHSNDPIHPVLSVPAHMHVVGVPDIALAPSSIAFGDVFTGGTKAETLYVSNTGLEVLHVTDITSDAAAFSASPTAFTVSPGVTKPILARFTAPALGPSSGTLSVHSDDPDEGVLTVSVSGNGTPPPILSSVPGSFSVSLVHGEKETRTLHFGNEGTVDLTYRLSVHGVPPAALAAAARALAPATVPMRPGGFVAGVTPASRPYVAPAGAGVRASTSIGAKVLLVEDVLPYGLDANEQLLAANGIAYDVINTSQLAATDLTHYEVMIVPSHQTNDAYNAIAARSVQIATFVGAGGVLEFHGAAESGISNSDLVTLPGGVHPSATYQSLTNYVLVPGHELTVGLGDTYTAICASYTHFSPLPVGVPKLIIDESNKATLVEYAFGSGRVIAAGQPLEFAWVYGWEEGVVLSNLIPYSLRRAEVGWFAMSGVAGIVPPGESVDAELAFDPGDLSPGTYRALLTVGTNDPAHANVPIALQLDVSQVVGTNVSLASSKVDGGHVLLAWQGGAPGLAATLYRRGVADEWASLASLTADGGGGFAFEDAGVVAGQRYAYRLGIVEGGIERFTSEAWIDVPETARLALRGLASNPVVGDVVVTFSLPDARSATLELLDVLGRRVASQEVGVLGAGVHTMTLAGDVRPAPGLYLVRLRHPAGTLVLRAAVIR
jgi:subtilisin family serine protease